MRLPAEFVRLPLRVDPDRLRREVEAVDPSGWRDHPEGAVGNDALSLISAGGDPGSDSTRGPMRPTPHLATMPYTRQVLASVGSVVGRTRLMRIAGDAEARLHVDVNYYWFDRVRVHVPVITEPGVRFLCGDRETHMPAGEMWVFDTWRPHNVLNPGQHPRVHLVIDTVGSPSFWDLVERGEVNPTKGGRGRQVRFDPDIDPAIDFECVNHPVVMPPAELERLLGIITDGLEGRERDRRALDAALNRLRREWRSLWSIHGDSRPAAFSPLVKQAVDALDPLKGALVLPNGRDAVTSIKIAVLSAAINPEVAPQALAPTPPAAPMAAPTRARRPSIRPLDRPIFIVSPPRSGSSLLFETLAQSPGLVTVGGESHQHVESVTGLHPADRGWSSNRLTAADATPDVVQPLRARLAAAMRDRDGRSPDGRPLTLLEKTPKNALRVPFLAAAFPLASFVYLYRDPIDTLASMVEGWRSGRFTTYADLPGWDGPAWSFLLTPGWEELRGLDIPEIAARQWSSTVETLIQDLEALPAARWCVASYGKLIAEPQAEIERLCGFLDVPWDRELTAPLPHSKTTLTPPAPGKWHHIEDELHPVLPIVAGASERARALFAEVPGVDRALDAVKRRPAREPYTDEEIDTGFKSRATKSFAPLLAAMSSSLVVTTYQTGRVILVREQDGQINTHLRSFDLPMGVAAHENRLVIGTRHHVWEYRDQPAVARKVEPAGTHDACYLPRRSHVTGDLRIHDVAIDGDGEVWAVNTLFSCLATFDAEHSFVPRWQPWFITGLAPEDRCHLNGLAMVDGAPRFVTALGTTDTAGGWRADKAGGGVVIDIESNEIVARGLSMPHSPRWHDGRLWVLESGVGRLGRVDLRTGEVETIAEMPGFTRGLSFAGPYAFIGLSQVRETLFEGVPIKDRPDRACGVWVIDTRDGQTVAFLRFEGLVQEIFDVQVLHGRRFPDLGEPDDKRAGASYVVPDAALAGVPSGLRG
jgi:uncharacterized protein (TIGR03032 family)